MLSQIFYVVDWQLLGVASLYSCLSFVMFYVIWRFPLVCQLFWPLISIWGIAGVHIGMAIVYPETRAYFWHFVTIFLFSLPGMGLLYGSQMVKLFKIFDTYKVSYKQVGFYIYLKEWLRDWLNDEVDSTDSDFYNGDDCPNHYPSADKVRLN